MRLHRSLVPEIPFEPDRLRQRLVRSPERRQGFGTGPRLPVRRRHLRGLGVLDGKLIDNESHLARLVRSVGEIALPLPETIERIQEIQRD